MDDKLYFSIEDAEIVEESPNSNFAVLNLDFFASGENLNNFYVSDETLLKTAKTIKNCPVVWKYNSMLDDAGSHHEEEVPCGFVPETAEIKSRILPDGRTMLSVVAYVWKRYTGEILNFFKRDGGKKPVSVEMIVTKAKKLANGLTELVDYAYQGITVLGTNVNPAIPLANATVLSFSDLKEAYTADYQREFNTDGFKIPAEVKSVVRTALQLENRKTASPIDLSFAKELSEQESLSYDRIRTIATLLDIKTGKSRMFFGGDAGYEWMQEVITFPYKTKGDLNPALKGISPPITVGQANEIARQAEGIGQSDEKNGWAIAISNFKKTHEVIDGKWVRKEKKEISMEEEKKDELEGTQVDNAEAPKGDPENPSQEKLPADQKEELRKEEKFEFPTNMGLEAMQEMFGEEEEEEEEEVKMARAELAKGEFGAPSTMMAAMFAKMCKMASRMKAMKAEAEAYMAENKELKEFKASVDESKKNFEVTRTLDEISTKVIVPDDARQEMIDASANFSIDTLDEWKNMCKAKSFEFAVREPERAGEPDEDVQRVGMPFAATTHKKENDLWA